MTAPVLPFPAAARLDLVARQAEHMAARDHHGSEEYLRRQLHRHRQVLERKQVEPEAIEADVAAYEGAVRAALWRLVLTGGRGGGGGSAA